LSDTVGGGLSFSTLGDVRARLVEVNQLFDQIGDVEPAAWSAFGEAGSMSSTPLTSAVANYYMTCPISRASETMAECAREFVRDGGERTGTDG
ncbi:MAG: NADH-quinone oxidoreductase subunit G, partial [Alphaproteobacteria bacterium]|nr:NADH-quinone oxidoreductase subunit G [Alphaproteobacteria bacterium]